MFERILITGAGGRLGQVLRQGLRGRHATLRLLDRSDLGEAQTGEETVTADLASFDQVDEAMRNIDAVIHLGAKLGSDPSEWDQVLHSNIIGTYNVFEAARRNGTKRVIFASSHHVVGFYRRERVVGVDAPPRPDSPYGVSKVFGEALGRLYADKYGISVICQRIGVARPTPLDVRSLRAWHSHDDFLRLTRCCLEAPDVHFLVVYGASANSQPLWDNPTADAIGYVPRDNAEDHIEAVLAGQQFEDEPEIERLFHGGWYCAADFSGDPEKID